jgi:hypothetical protein
MHRSQRAASARGRAGLALLVVALTLTLSAIGGAGVASASAATVSGRLTTAAGDPVAGVELTLSGPEGLAATALTGLDGSYSLTVDSGSFDFIASIPEGGDPVPGLPEQWSFSGRLDVGSSDQTLDIALPAVRTLTVRVLDSHDAPQEGFIVSLPELHGSTTSSPSFQLVRPALDAVTDAAGEIHALEFDGSGGGRFGNVGDLTPPDGGAFLPSTFGFPAITGDATLVVHAVEASEHVTGVLRDAAGDPVAGAKLTLGAASDVTGADGSYTLGVPLGNFTLSGRMDDGGGALGLPDQWSFSGSLRVTGDRTLDLRLPPVSTLTVRVLDGENGDAPLEGAGVELPRFDSRELVDMSAGFTADVTGTSLAAPTDAAGESRVLEFDRTSPHFGREVTVTPPESSGYEPLTSSLPDVDGDTTVVVRVPVPFYWVTGVVRQTTGTPIAGVNVSVGAESTTTAADGSYRVKARPGNNGLTLAMPDAAAAGLPPNWRLTGTFSAFADRTLDVSLEALHVTTRVLGDEDEPVPNAEISIPRFSFFFPLERLGELTNVQLLADPLTLTTDANGEAQYVEFSGTQPRFGAPAFVRPPAGSGYGTLAFQPSFNRFDLLDVEHVHDVFVPSIAFDQSPDGANGWWTSRPASVHVTARDARIDTLACTVDGVSPRRGATLTAPDTLALDLSIRDEGRHGVSCTAMDRSDNDTTERASVTIDLGRPFAPVLAADRAPDFSGATGDWFADTVTVTATDAGDPLLADGSAGSGVDPASVPAPQTFATSGRHVAGATVADLAGNVSRAATLTVRVDATAPSSTLTCPAGTVALGARANALWDDADADSGLAGTNHGRVALDTTTPGLHTAHHTATDRVGHVTSSSCDYTVA